MVNNNLIFIKLGGSLITEKDVPNSARIDVITDLAKAIKRISISFPQFQFILGHGSGSFGHYVANKYSTQNGVFTTEQWLGFLKVWQTAHKLNQIVFNALSNAELPIISFSPSSSITSKNKKIVNWNLSPIRSALLAGYIPMVMGDVVFDTQIGGTILSTETLFYHLAMELEPATILIAGIETGVYADFPQCLQLVPKITQNNFALLNNDINQSNSIDVTGGMNSKVKIMMELCNQIPELEVRIFSAIDSTNLEKALLGEPIGTLISRY